MIKEDAAIKLFALLHNYGIEKGQITQESHFMKDLGLDSLDISELLLNVEQKFDITINEEEWSNISTYSDLLSLILTKS
jgi:acyl carrier protein